MASPTSSGTCDPPGASKKANPPRSDENRARTACTSITVVLMCASLPRVQTRALGGTGIGVSGLVLGCGNYGGIGSAPAFFGQGESREEAFAIMDRAWELGITTFDTADAYGGGRSETWIGEWRRGKGPEVRDGLVLSTKVFHSVEGDPTDHGLAPDRIRRQLEGSLRRLGVECVDMYLRHEPDPDTPLADTLGALGEPVREGKVRAVGVRDVGGGIRRATSGHH